jgi:hypothetical protein
MTESIFLLAYLFHGTWCFTKLDKLWVFTIQDHKKRGDIIWAISGDRLYLLKGFKNNENACATANYKFGYFCSEIK